MQRERGARGRYKIGFIVANSPLDPWRTQCFSPSPLVRRDSDRGPCTWARRGPPRTGCMSGFAEGRTGSSATPGRRWTGRIRGSWGTLAGAPWWSRPRGRARRGRVRGWRGNAWWTGRRASPCRSAGRAVPAWPCSFALRLRPRRGWARSLGSAWVRTLVGSGSLAWWATWGTTPRRHSRLGPPRAGSARPVASGASSATCARGPACTWGRTCCVLRASCRRAQL